MSNKANPRRGHGKIQGNGPRYENPNPEAGCNSTHVARSRAKWKRRMNRVIRRTGSLPVYKYHRRNGRGAPPRLPEDNE